MWRKTTFAGNYDSDQSISEEEDLASDWPENCIALCGTEERKEQIQIQSQLVVLRDTHERDHGTETSTVSNKRQTGFFSDEEVEFPVFHDDGGFISSPRLASLCNSEEDILSDNENPQEAGLRFPEMEKGSCSWSVVTKEAEALAHLSENARCSSLRAIASKENKHVKGGRGKSKSKFLFHFQSHKEDMPLPPLPVSSNPEVSMSSKFLPLVQGLEAVDKSTTANSMAELLDSYQEKTNSKMYKSMEAQRVQLVDERSVSLSGKIDMDNNVPPEDLDSESSSDDGVSPQDNAQNLGLIIPDSVQKAMSDKFQEAFGVASANEEGLHLPLHGIGLFGKLQRVMQREKKTEVDFMKKLEIGANLKDEASCFDVEILSRCLEAKLTVCCCSLRRDNEGFQLTESLQMAKGGQRRTLTIIFGSRVCEDVELEVGSLICIHSPWNEVLGKDEKGTSSIHPPPVNVLDPNTPPALPAGYPPSLPFQPPQLPAGYPPPAMGQYGYPGYPLHPPPGAGYPPMEPGYGYPPVQQQQHPPRRNHYAQSAGLVGALIGAMVIGENLGN